jgi:protein-disulfide isomerase
MPRPPAPAVEPVRSGGPPAALIGGVVVLMVVLVGVLVWAATRGGGLDATGSTSSLPDGGGVNVGPGPEADVTQVRIYEDFQCPWCGRLENSIGEPLTDKAEAGEINLTFQIMSFLDGQVGNDSSTRAANAALCADDAGVFVPFHASVYADMGQEGQGYTDEQFVQWAQDAGLDGGELDTFQQCLADQTHADYVDAMQERANRDGVTGTPTMVVNGTTLGNEDMGTLLQDPGALDEILEANS